MSNDIHRLTYTHRSGFYRLTITDNGGGKVAGARFVNRPKIVATREWLAAKGFEAYGDMRLMSDGSYVSMVRKTATATTIGA